MPPLGFSVTLIHLGVARVKEKKILWVGAKNIYVNRIYGIGFSGPNIEDGKIYPRPVFGLFYPARCRIKGVMGLQKKTP